MNPSPEQVRAAYRALPFPVREYLVSSKLYDLVQEFGQKYSLHVDTIGLIVSAVTNMLLGFSNPIQFQTELVRLGIPDAVVDSIIQELNEKIFKPLRDAMRNAPPETESEEKPAPAVQHLPATVTPPPIPAQPVPPPPAVFQSAPAPEVPRRMPPANLPGVSMPAPAPYIPPQPAPTPVTPAPRPSQNWATAPEERSAPVPMPASTEPSWARTSSVAPPAPPTPRPTMPAPVPPPVSPPPLRVPATPAPTPVSGQSSGREELHAVLKKYGVDPYREPPE